MANISHVYIIIENNNPYEEAYETYEMAIQAIKKKT